MAIPLYQYWHSPDPPDEVAAWMCGMRDTNRALSYRRYDARSGRTYIDDRLGGRAAAAFDACAHPAMEADLLRLALLWAEGGLWVDSGGLQAIRPIDELLDQIPYAFVSAWAELWVNTVMFFRRPGSPYLRACIDLVLDNIAARRCTKALTATGPGVMNAVRCALGDPQAEAIGLLAEGGAWNGWGFIETVTAARALIVATPALDWDRRAIVSLARAPFDPYLAREQAAYKARDDYWFRSEAPIYR